MLEYKYFDESEWRIIWSEGIKNILEERLEKKYFDKMKDNFIDAESYEKENMDFRNYLQYLRDKGIYKTSPRYLIPLKDTRWNQWDDRRKKEWFSMIIYPSLAVKVRAEEDKEIRKLISEIKSCGENESEREHNKSKREYNDSETWEIFSSPIEIDLDSCRNF